MNGSAIITVHKEGQGEKDRTAYGARSRIERSAAYLNGENMQLEAGTLSKVSDDTDKKERGQEVTVKYNKNRT